MRTCKRCGQENVEGECPACLEFYEARPDPSTMTPDERVKEFDSWQWLEITFDKIHKRLEELVGRPVWTHEFGLGWDGLREEARQRTCQLPTLEEICKDIPAERLVIVGVKP